MSVSYYGPLVRKGSIITPPIRKAIRETRAYATATLKARTPVDTGRMRASWDTRTEALGLRMVNDAPYAIFVEYGTKHMRARRPLARSIDDINNHFRAQLTRRVGQRLSDKITDDRAKITVGNRRLAIPNLTDDRDLGRGISTSAVEVFRSRKWEARGRAVFNIRQNRERYGRP